ncbi:MAG: iron uptake porin, partial [Leptolyngbyaceae bacterium]|nr:iron uptake porin [Leptolyngbyaceae bacterium]
MSRNPPDRRSHAVSLSLVCLFLAHTLPALAGSKADLVMEQFTSIDQLADVRPTDWAFQAVQSLAERYGCLAGYPDGTLRGNQTLTRYEFAAGLNACVDRISSILTATTTDRVSQADLRTLQSLQETFAAELATLRGRVDALEARTATLEKQAFSTAQAFSTTTKLTGQLVFAANGGGFTGDRLVDPRGMTIATSDPNPTTIYRVALDLNTSFTGTDLLKLRLGAASGGANDNAAAVLEPNFGSGLDFSSKPPSTGNFEITRLYYTFRPTSDFTVTIAPDMRITDYVDLNYHANLSFRDFSTEAFVNNYVLFPINGPGAGAVVAWNPSKGGFTFRALYVAADAANPSQQGLLKGTAPFIRLLYPISGNPVTANLGGRGLFGDSAQSFLELEYAPSRTAILRLQYTRGEVYGHAFEGLGINAEVTIARNLGLVGRYGYSRYDNTGFGDIQPNYWMAGVVLRDAWFRGALAGVAVGQPFIESDI